MGALFSDYDDIHDAHADGIMREYNQQLSRRGFQLEPQAAAGLREVLRGALQQPLADAALQRLPRRGPPPSPRLRGRSAALRAAERRP